MGLGSKNKGPCFIDLKAGYHLWCTCGKSGEVICDGAHAGTSDKPLRFKVEEDSTQALCTCKKTKTPPYCDGTHMGK